MISKAKLLAKYAQKPVSQLAQLDCFSAKSCDSIITDVGGFGSMMTVTEELMSMAPDARLLVRLDADLESVRKWLLFMADRIEREVPTFCKTTICQDNGTENLREALDILLNAQIRRSDSEMTSRDLGALGL